MQTVFKQKEKDDKQTDKVFKDLIYDLESFVIDTFYDHEVSSEKKSFELLSKKLTDEKEHTFVFSKLRPVLVCLGIREQTGGFRLIEECVLHAVRMKMEGKEIIMKQIYETVSAKNNLSSYNCERMCRYACKSIHLTSDFVREYPFLESLTHRTYEKITVKELVENLTYYLIIECKFKTKLSFSESIYGDVL